MTTTTKTHNVSHATYNTQIINRTDPLAYKPVDNQAFHHCTPNNCKGIHRSLNPADNNPNFNINNIAQQSCLHQASILNDTVMVMNITEEEH